MTDAGYTLTETLAAMAVIGLASGGLALGVQVLGGQQGSIGAVVLNIQQTREAEAWLERRLEAHGPFRAHEADRFVGAAGEVRFDCGSTASCTMRLSDEGDGPRLELFRGEGDPATFRLPSEQPARFVFRSGGEILTSWPPGGGARQALRGVSLLQGEAEDERVILSVRLYGEQPLDCAYDPVLQDCR